MNAYNSQFDILKMVAQRGLRNQVQRKGDFIGPDGMLMCGKCGEARQKMMELAAPTEGDLSHMSTLMAAASCRCDREKEEREKREEQAKKDMERIERLRGASLMDEKFKCSTFDTFSTNKYNEKNMTTSRRYVEKFDEMLQKNRGLLFWGDVGTGKSFTAACIANALLAKKVPVVMTSFIKLLVAIQSNQSQETEIMSRLNRAKLVIFDDLGAERDTDYALEKVYNIVDSRSRKCLPMLLTTNLSLQQMKGEADIRYRRIYDRIFETCYPMQFTGQSWRKKEASRGFEEMEKLLGG